MHLEYENFNDTIAHINSKKGPYSGEAPAKADPKFNRESMGEKIEKTATPTSDATAAGSKGQ